MRRDEFYSILQALEDGTITEISADEGYALLDSARLYDATLSTGAMDTVTAAISHAVPKGFTMRVERRPDGFRFTLVRTGAMLPAESGDDTP